MKMQMVTGACLLAVGSLVVPVMAHTQTMDSDKQFLATAAQSDMNEIKLSQLAEAKATNPQVKAYARKMVADHMRLETKMKPFAMKWGLTPPSGPDSEHQSIYDKLNGLSGSDFDHQYMMAMDQDHHKALDLFTQEESSTQNARFKAAVENGKSVVAMHTTMADSLAAKV